jgi:hypothetical protein
MPVDSSTSAVRNPLETHNWLELPPAPDVAPTAAEDALATEEPPPVAAMCTVVTLPAAGIAERIKTDAKNRDKAFMRREATLNRVS